MRVFLGGTCNESTWRDDLIPLLLCDYFNPVVDDWTPECQAEEIRQRETCDFVLYTLTPRMTGVYSVAEVVDDSNKRPGRTLFCYLADDGERHFAEGQLRSMTDGTVRAMHDWGGGMATSGGEYDGRGGGAAAGEAEAATGVDQAGM